MAQLEPAKKYAKSTSIGPREITVEYLLQAHDINSPARGSPTSWKINNDQDEEDQEQQPKKSVLAKVKEKARKLKQTLSMKKHNHDDEDDNASSSPAPGDHASLDADKDEQEQQEEEDPEYYGAPMYESELAPEDVKEAARLHPREDVEILEKHVLVGKGKETTEEDQQVTKEIINNNSGSSKTITESVTEKLAPAYAMATEATQMITSKIQDMAIATSLALERKGSGGVFGDQKWDKGVSMKEYLMQKLEPGDDERALSQVISEAISPKKGPGEKGVVEKVKGTVSTLFGKEEPSTISPSPVSPSSSQLASVTKAEATASSSSRPPSNIPVSWNAYQGAEEEENEGRILQTN